MARPMRYALTLTLGWIVLASCTENSIPTEPAIGRDQPTAAELALTANSWTTKPIMPTARGSLASAVVNNSLHQPILYAIGGSDGFVSLNTVEAYNAATDAWSAKAPLPVVLQETNGAGVIAGKVYVSGGRGFDDSNITPFPQRSLYVYDPVTDSWSRKADMPLPSLDGVTGVVNGKLYVLTGERANNFFRYNPSTDTWSSLPNCPTMHFRAAGAVIHGQFYVAGGERFTSEGPIVLNKLHVYDPVTNRWSEKASMPRRVFAAAGAPLLGQLYVTGGLKANASSGRIVQAYDPVADTWALKARMPTGRYDLAASRFIINGQQRIVAVGGFEGSVPLGANEVYTP